MCVAVPVRIIEIKHNFATVDIGDSSSTQVNVSFVDAKPGDYLIVNAGFGIRVVDENEAQETIKIWKRIQEIYKDDK